MALAAVLSKAVILLLLIRCCLLLPLRDSVIVLCFLYVTLCPSSFAIISMGKRERERELDALLCLSSWFIVIVV